MEKEIEAAKELVRNVDELEKAKGPYVDVQIINSKFQQKFAGRLRWDEASKKIVREDVKDKSTIDFLMEADASFPSPSGFIGPKDGLKYLKGLSGAFSQSSRLAVSNLKNEK